MKENGFSLAKARCRYPAQTIADSHYVDSIALLAITHVQAESLLHSLEKATGGSLLHFNADKTEYMSFNQNQNGDIFILKSGSLKLVDKFTYLGSSISSTENINKSQAKTYKFKIKKETSPY